MKYEALEPTTDGWGEFFTTSINKWMFAYSAAEGRPRTVTWAWSGFGPAASSSGAKVNNIWALIGPHTQGPEGRRFCRQEGFFFAFYWERNLKCCCWDVASHFPPWIIKGKFSHKQKVPRSREDAAAVALKIVLSQSNETLTQSGSFSALIGSFSASHWKPHAGKFTFSRE